MKIILLDGICQGQVFQSGSLPPGWKILKPQDLEYHTFGDGEFIPAMPSEVEYKRTFVSADGKWGLYTENGDPEALVSSRDWVKPKNSWIQARPLYVMEED